MLGQLSNSALGFDSPSTAAALGLAGPGDLPPDHDPVDDLREMRPITRDDDKLKRLEIILDTLNVSLSYPRSDYDEDIRGGRSLMVT